MVDWRSPYLKHLPSYSGPLGMAVWLVHCMAIRQVRGMLEQNLAFLINCVGHGGHVLVWVEVSCLDQFNLIGGSRGQRREDFPDKLAGQPRSGWRLPTSQEPTGLISSQKMGANQSTRGEHYLSKHGRMNGMGSVQASLYISPQSFPMKMVTTR